MSEQTTGETAPAPAESHGYTPPFTCTASSTLSEDLYVTSDLIMNPGDRVLPFADGPATSALVLHGGDVLLLRRDPATASGWSYKQPLGFGGKPITRATDLAVVTDRSGQTWAVTVVNEASYAGVASDPASWMPLRPQPPAGASPWKSGTGPAGQAYFYCFGTDGAIYLTSPAEDRAVYPVYPFTDAGFTDGLVLWNPVQMPNGAHPGWVLTVDHQGVLSGWEFQTVSSVDPKRKFGGSKATPFWMQWPESATDNPSFLCKTGEDTLAYSSPSGLVTLGTFQQLTADQVSVWFDSGRLAWSVVVNEKVTAFAQYGDPADATFTPGIAIADGVHSLFGLPSDPAEATLFTISSEDTLGVLVKDPVQQTWSQQPVQQAAPTAQHLSAWRTTISVTDANGIAVRGAAVRVTADAAVGVWQPTGNTLITPGTPGTFTTNDKGQVNLAIPAFDLDAPRLTAQVLDAQAAAAGEPLAIAPDAGVHAFLAGAAPLSDLPVLTAASLAAAKSPDGQPLSPVLAALPATERADAAAAVAKTLSGCITAGNSPGTAGPVQSFLLDMTGKVPVYTESANAYDPATAVGTGLAGELGSPAWWEAMKHDVHAFTQSVRQDFAKVVQCGAQFAADLGNWVVNLTVDIENIGRQIASIVVHDIRTAITAIHGVLNTIKVDADRALNWLRMAFSGLLTHTSANAATVLGWIEQVPLHADAALDGLPSMVDGYFSEKEAEVQDKIADAAAAMGATTFTTYRTDGPDLPGLGKLVKLMSFSPANWLIDKIESEFDGHKQPDIGGDPLTGALEKLVEAVITQGVDSVLAIGEDMWAEISNTVKKPRDFDQYAIAALLDVVSVLATQLLELADDIIQALIALARAVVDEFMAVLTAPVDDVPLVHGILNKLGIDDSLTVGHLFTLIPMFPVTLVYQLVTDGQGGLFPAEAAAAAAHEDRDPWGFGLTLTRGVLRILQGAVDLGVDWDIVQGDTVTPDSQQWANFIGLGVGFSEFVVNYPGRKVDGKTRPPFKTGIDLDGTLNQGWFARWLITSVSPTIAAAMTASKSRLKEGLPGYKTWSPFVAALMFDAVLALGIWVDMDRGEPVETTAIRAVEIAPRVIAPLAMQFINETTDYVPIGIKSVADLVEAIAGALIVLEALYPPE